MATEPTAGTHGAHRRVVVRGGGGQRRDMFLRPGVPTEVARTPQTGWPDRHQALSGTPAHGLAIVGRSDGSGFRVTVPDLG